MTRIHQLEILRRYFGHDSFRPGQQTLVEALLEGKDALGVMPTGAGKSICYQVPALMKQGVTLVISPLISLMADQVAALKSAGVPAAYLNSSLTPRQLELATQRAWEGAYRIIYVAPERLEAPSFQRFAQSVSIAMIAVDEAHCVSQWGQDFRPVYLRIADFVDSLPVRPVMGAFTATATPRVREDIIRLLRLNNPVTASTGFDRPNLYFEVVQPKNRDAALEAIVREKRGESGIIYCATRKAVEEVCDKLRDAGFAAGRYHAGLSDAERRSNQEDFQYDRIQIMVATNAFGMGIDKSNVRYVIHYNMPRSMEAYYQEAGRAGRDGDPAECILLYCPQDIFTARWMIDNSEPNADLSALEQANVRRLDHQRLQQMIAYSTYATCQRRFILNYFGDKTTGSCGDCGYCTGGRYGQASTIQRAGGRKNVRKKCYHTESTVQRPTTPVRSARPPVQMEPPSTQPINETLFDKLRAVRMQLAKQERVPPYIICTDMTLNDMVRQHPRTRQAMLNVKGMGDIKVQKYGDAFLAVLRESAGGSESSASAENSASVAVPMKPSVPPSTPSTVSRSKPTAASQAMASVYRRPERPSDDDHSDDALQDAYLSGMTISELAQQFETSPARIRERLRQMDLIF